MRAAVGIPHGATHHGAPLRLPAAHTSRCAALCVVPRLRVVVSWLWLVL